MNHRAESKSDFTKYCIIHSVSIYFFLTSNILLFSWFRTGTLMYFFITGHITYQNVSVLHNDSLLKGISFLTLHTFEICKFLEQQIFKSLTYFFVWQFFSGMTYYKMNNLDSRIANPDQLLTQVRSLVVFIGSSFGCC